MSIINKFAEYINSRRLFKTVNNYENSKYGKDILQYKDKHKGKRCFICGNGPSLNASDLDRLYKAGEITFGTNRVYNIFDKAKWRPTYYACEDELIIKEHQSEINAIECERKFIPINLKWYHGVNIKNACYFYLYYRGKNASKYNFSPNMAKQLDCRGTITFTCMQIAAYMGFSEIYLIGVDHNYNKIIDENGNIITDDSVKDYFSDDYDKDIKDVAVHNMGKNARAYREAKAYCDENGIKIYNATRGGKLEIFERVNLDDLLDGKIKN